MALPALRLLDVAPIEHEGDYYICLSDPEGFVEEQMVLTPAAFFIASQLTGHNEVADVQRAFQAQFNGTNIGVDSIYEVVHNLDQEGFLHTEAFKAIRRQVTQSFAQLPVRPARLAGKSYPSDPDELRAFLDAQFLREGGPGEAPGDEPGTGPALKGLIVPHIDYQRGGHCYAHGYHAMFKQGRPDTVFIFGVAHMNVPAPFILTRKGYETPFGTLETDAACLDRLEAACEWDAYEHELVHRTEHSIEFQTVMLARLYGRSIRIVPILCSTFSEDPGFSDPGSVEALETFLNACRECVQSPGKQVSVIASVDLAHVGKRFGDPFDIDESIIESVATRDHEDLALVHSIEPDAFYASVMKDANQRRLCGLNGIYATLKSLDGTVKEGRPLHYDFAPDPAGGIVSFASIALM